jgi:YD repeat-containing protein
MRMGRCHGARGFGRLSSGLADCRPPRLVRRLLPSLGVVALVAALSPALSAGADEQPGNEDKPGVNIVRELTGLRTASSDTFLLSDGTRSERVYPHAVNYRGANGAWQPIEDGLIQATDGSWRPAGSPVPISLPATLATSPVSVGPADRQLSLALEGANEAQGTSAGAQRSYRQVLPDVDVTYTATPGSVRETLSLENSSAPAVYRYKLSLSPGLKASLAPSGRVDVSDESGKVVYWMDPPTVSDSSAPRHLPSTAPLHYALSEDGSVLSLVLDRSWLEDPKRVFPVKIDPEAWFTEAEDCSIISQAQANWQECGGHLSVGADAETPKDVSRTVLHFDLSSVPQEATVLHSRLSLWFLWPGGTESPIDVEVFALTRDFTQEVTWNSYDGTNAWTTAGGDFASTVIGAHTVSPIAQDEYHDWGMTAQVAQWIREPSTNHGILLKAHDETASTYDTFAATDDPESEPEPFIEVIYEPQRGNPSNGTMIEESLGNNATMGVNVANGNLNVNDPDIRYEGEGYETEVSRSYNSLDDNSSEAQSFHDWMLSPAEDTSLNYPSWDSSLALFRPDGSSLRFDRELAGDGTPSPGDKAFQVEPALVEEGEESPVLVEHSDGTRTLTDPNSEKESTFDNDGFLASVVDPRGEGNTISLSYTSELLTEAKDTHGHTLAITRNPETTYVTKIKDGSEEWKYSYDGFHRLTAYKGPSGQEAEYVYRNEDDKLIRIVDPSGTYVISYDGEGRVVSTRHIVNGTVSTPGSEDEVTSYAYGPPESPTCDAETDIGQTVVTVTPGEETPSTYCYDVLGRVTGYSGAEEEGEAEATEGLEEQEEIPEGTCYEDSEFPAKYCGAEDPPAENTEGEGEGFVPLVSGSPPDIGAINYGLAENNRLATFNAFTNTQFKNLHVGQMRRTVPWDEVWEGIHASNLTAVAHYEELKTWVTDVKALRGGTGQPTISFDRCSTKWVNPLKAEQFDCTMLPDTEQYEMAIKAFLEDPTLKGVTHFTAWNEPNNRSPEVFGEPSAVQAGKYWRALDTICVKLKPGCQVAAGDFLDSEMPNANDKEKGGGRYFKEYAAAMGYAPAAKHWAWHAYKDGEVAGTSYRGKPTKWWTRFKNFKKAINKASHGPDIWLTEQGVRFYSRGQPLPAHHSENTANAIMHAYVSDGANQLTRRGQVTKFFYYAMLGDKSSQDSGLLTPTRASRKIYGIYRGKTPKS